MGIVNRISYKDVALRLVSAQNLAFLDDENNWPSRHTLLRACIEMRRVSADALAQRLWLWIQEHMTLPRGRRPPAAGVERRYSVQRTKEGLPFVRVPVQPLGLEFGDEVMVEFENGKVVVVPMIRKKHKIAREAKPTLAPESRPTTVRNSDSLF